MLGIVVLFVFQILGFSFFFFFFNIAQGMYAFFLPAFYFLSACFQKKYVILFFPHIRGNLFCQQWILFLFSISYFKNSLGYKTVELAECLLRREDIHLHTQMNSFKNLQSTDSHFSNFICRRLSWRRRTPKFLWYSCNLVVILVA